MRRISLILLVSPVLGFAQEKRYAADLIQAELKEKANVVVRVKEEQFTIHSKSKATHSIHGVYTILNEKGKRYATAAVFYSKLQKVTEFKGVVYNGAGEVIRKLKQTDIYDQSAVSGGSLYEDNRVKVAELTQGSYPYTVEYTYELEYKFLFYLPEYSLAEDEGVSVENSKYILAAPPELMPRYKLLNTDQKMAISIEEGKTVWTWTFKNSPAYLKEPLGERIYEVAPRILAGPTQFEFEKFSGTMDSWDKFGQWIISLNRDRGQVAPETKQKIAELTQGLPVEEKIKKVYEYMQAKTRYVSVQIGIGGYQPFEAKVVDETGYGDCKALSNYTVSLLDAAGVKAHYVLVRAGFAAPKLDPGFPSTQFNHAIVAVPNGRDTLWLECTSQTNPFGYMGTFTGDRNALMITDNGAVVVSTPRYPAERNLQSRTAEVAVEVTGDARATVRTTYAGLQYENNYLQFILNNQFDEQKKWVQKNTDIPSFDINSFSMVNRKARIPSAIVTLDLNLRKYATASGKRIFLNPNLMNRSTFIPEKVEKRKTKVIKDIGFVDLDTIRFTLPDEIYPEFIPETVKITTRFGEYEATYKIDQGSLLYVRKVKMNKGEFPPETYEELVNFYRSMNKADQTKIVFLSKT